MSSAVMVESPAVLQSILKKNQSRDHASAITSIPNGFPVYIAHIRDSKTVFYRTAEMFESYKQLEKTIAGSVRNAKLTEVYPFNLMPKLMYLFKDSSNNKFHRVRVIEGGFLKGKTDVRYEFVDSGEQQDYFEGMGAFYPITKEIRLWEKTVTEPFSLACVEGKENIFTVAKLRTLVPSEDQCCFLSVQQNESSTCAKDKENQKPGCEQFRYSYRSLKPNDNPAHRAQVTLYRNDGTDLNKKYNEYLRQRAGKEA
ncbi:hypothetical protein DdX_22205 [Ditylenchus destructor]|uniref:Uncharacterized protein n=1 Tax=Ditylenchus destructor TaxID=166010 RepID=A0AAD4MG40_9BILA|nr:hypothetical protein DdX_22205 [Ditylenchus destructor]